MSPLRLFYHPASSASMRVTLFLARAERRGRAGATTDMTACEDTTHSESADQDTFFADFLSIAR